MKLVSYHSAGEFLAAAGPLLEADEAVNNLILGLALRLSQGAGEYPEPPLLITVSSQAGEAVLAALQTPPNRIILASGPLDAVPALDVLARHLLDCGDRVPGAVGPARLAEQFAAVWSQRTGAQAAVSMRERVYVLHKVQPPAVPPGQPVQAGRLHLDLVLRWWADFQVEAMHDSDPPEANRRLVTPRLEAGDLWLWEDGGPVALAGIARRTPHGAVVGPVYTPPDLRRRGYAAALTAALSQHELDRGAEFLALFTDLANPTSNKIYQEIGYQPVTDFLVYDFPPRRP